MKHPLPAIGRLLDRAPRLPQAPSGDRVLRFLLALLLLFLIAVQLVVKDEVDVVVGGLVAGLFLLALLSRISEFQGPGGIGLKLVGEAAQSSEVQQAIEGFDKFSEEADARGLPDQLRRRARADPQHTIAEAASYLRRRIATIDGTIRGRDFAIDHPGVIAALQRKGVVKPEVAELCQRVTLAADRFMLLADPKPSEAVDLFDMLDRAYRAIRPLAVLDRSVRTWFEEAGWTIDDVPPEGKRRPDFTVTKPGQRTVRVKTIYTRVADSQLPRPNARRLAETDADLALVVLPHRSAFPLPVKYDDKVWIIGLEHLVAEKLGPYADPKGPAALPPEPEKAAGREVAPNEDAPLPSIANEPVD